jgi:ABC-type uncharacterized transport system involved in gliding motility auxiliary subunit
MRIASIMMGVIGGVVLVTCVLTVFFFPFESYLLWGKISVGLAMVASALILNWEGVKTAATKKGTAFVLTSVMTTAGLGGILAGANYFAAQHKKEFDLTKDQVFTLSEQTLKTLAEIKEEVIITGFYRKDEPEGDALDDLTGRYGIHTDKLRVSMVAPEEHPDLVEKYKVTETSPRIIIESRGQEARVKEITEEALTNALMQVSQGSKKKLYVTQGHGEPLLESSEESGIKAGVEDLKSEGYEVDALNLVEKQQVPDDAAALWVMAPQKAFFEPEVKLLKEYLDKGGKVFVMVEPGFKTGLEDLLKEYKVSIGNNTVIDVSQFGRLFGQGPDAAIVFQYGEHKATQDLENVATVFKGARSVSVADQGDANVHAEVLAYSSPRSWGETNLAGGDWQWDDGELKGPVPLAVAVTKNTKDATGKRADEARLVVMGDTDLANNQYRVLAGNRDLFLNLVAWIAEEENKISIRPKQRGASRIVLTPAQEALIAFFALDGMPVALLSFGLGIWLVRRRR